MEGQEEFRVEVQSREEDPKYVAYHLDSAVAAEKAGNVREETVPTEWGAVTVTVEGDIHSAPVILTYHDLGLNHGNCFESFIHMDDSWRVFQQFSFVHIDAPGHAIGSSDLPADYPAVTVASLVQQVEAVLLHLGVRFVIGFGVGAGATVLSHFALTFPDRVLALMLVGGCVSSASWLEWAYSKACLSVLGPLKPLGMDWVMEDFLMGRYFTAEACEEHGDLVGLYSRDLKLMSTKNIATYINAILQREDVAHNMRHLDCEVLVFVTRGASSYGSGVDLAAACARDKVEAVEVHGGHLLTEERPDLLLKPIALFLQGLGYNQGEYLASKAQPKPQEWQPEPIL